MPSAPAFPTAEMERSGCLWGRAIEVGLMASGAETKYRFTPDGKVLSVAVGRSGQLLAVHRPGGA